MQKKKNRERTTARRQNGVNSLAWLALAGAVIVVALVLLMTRPAAPVSAPDQAGLQTQALPREVSVSDAAQMRTDGAFVLDVREPEEWNEVHIPDATLIPLGQLQNRLDEIPQDQPVVVVCRSGNRSASGRDILLAAGFEQVTSMRGGMIDWQNQGFATTTGN